MHTKIEGVHLFKKTSQQLSTTTRTHNKMQEERENELRQIKWLALAKIREGVSLDYVKNMFIYEVEQKGVYTDDSMWVFLAKSTPSEYFSSNFVKGFKPDTGLSSDTLEDVASILHP